MPTEHQEQCAVIQWCALHEMRWPELWLIHAIPNGGDRHIAVAAKLKAEGVKPGVPDLFLPVPKGRYHGLYLEMKRKDGGRTTETQKRWHQGLFVQGYCFRVCKGADAAIKVIEAYLNEQKHP